MSSNHPTCIQCAYWTCAFENSCCNPEAEHFEQYVSGNEDACELFEPEQI